MDHSFRLYLPGGATVQDGDIDVLLDHAVERFGLNGQQRATLMGDTLRFWNGLSSRWEVLEITIEFGGKPIVKEFLCRTCEGWYSGHDPCMHCLNQGVCGCLLCDPNACELCGGDNHRIAVYDDVVDTVSTPTHHFEECPCYLEMLEMAEWDNVDSLVPVYRQRFYSCLECRETLCTLMYDDEVIEYVFVCNYGHQRAPERLTHQLMVRSQTRIDEYGVSPLGSATVTQWKAGTIS